MQSYIREILNLCFSEVIIIKEASLLYRSMAFPKANLKLEARISSDHHTQSFNKNTEVNISNNPITWTTNKLIICHPWKFRY